MSSETCLRLTANPLMTINTADRDAREYGGTAECRTRPMVDDFYQCQIHRADCGYAVPFRTSCLCLSDMRREYAAQRRQQEIRMMESIL
jgi:hypothetical protein